MTPEELSAALSASLEQAVASGELALAEDAQLPELKVERPKSREHGDWATNVAMQLTKKVGMPPREVAAVLKARFEQIEGVASVDIAGPGFLNIVLDAAAAGELARSIVEAGRELSLIHI